MKVPNASVFVGELTTIGRKTGLRRMVELRMVCLNGEFYAVSSNVQSKHWCRNMIHNPRVDVKAGGERFSCKARQVADDDIRVRVLNLRDSRAVLERVVFELNPVG